MNIWIFSVDFVMTFLLESDVDVDIDVDVDLDNVGLFFFLGVSDSDNFLVFSTTTTVQRIARENVGTFSIKLVDELALAFRSLSTSASGASAITGDWQNSGSKRVGC